MIRNDTIERARLRNPFLSWMSTELLDDPMLYAEMFSERILVGETTTVFVPTNTVLLGPHGSGKSMILNLIRYKVLAKWLSVRSRLPGELRHIQPFLGISINLTRANFAAFGRRSISRVRKLASIDPVLECSSAADFLNSYLFKEFLNSIEFLCQRDGRNLAGWIGIDPERLDLDEIAKSIASWEEWFGYYSSCRTMVELKDMCVRRILTWERFLNANIDEIPSDIWGTKSSLGRPLHAMGNLLSSLKQTRGLLPLFVVIDQYEIFRKLSPLFGTELLRFVNSLLEARDPVVFYKIGVRPHDWGRELRVWGADNQVAERRDYSLVNLSDVLMSHENTTKSIFRRFARDVAFKRLLENDRGASRQFPRRRLLTSSAPNIFGKWSVDKEVVRYVKKHEQRRRLTKDLPNRIARVIELICRKDKSALELRLASSWALQKVRRKMSEKELLKEAMLRPWLHHEWWRKERIETALCQMASLTNQKKVYFGWETVVALSGANISCFLTILGEVWDESAKRGIDPLAGRPLPISVQTEGIQRASQSWRERDKNDREMGWFRFQVLGLLASAINRDVVKDWAMSNPGYTGFSLREKELSGSENSRELADFIYDCVDFAWLEERHHTSKQKGDTPRVKWYLHPLLAPFFSIPYKRLKEPFYTDVETVFGWFFGGGKITLTHRHDKSKHQMALPFEV